jgi:hypothetical protein
MSIVTSNITGTGSGSVTLLDEDDMVSDSDSKGVTQQSVKAYVDDSVHTITYVESSYTTSNIGVNGQTAVQLLSLAIPTAGTWLLSFSSALYGVPARTWISTSNSTSGNVSWDAGETDGRRVDTHLVKVEHICNVWLRQLVVQHIMRCLTADRRILVVHFISMGIRQSLTQEVFNKIMLCILLLFG